MIRVAAMASATCLLMALSACSDTPDCGSSDAQHLLGEIIEEAFEKSVYGRQLRPLVDYRIRAIRTVSYQKNVDVYECAATLEITSAQGDGKPIETEFEYDVYSVQDDDADFEIGFDDGIDKAITRAALARAMGRH